MKAKVKQLFILLFLLLTGILPGLDAIAQNIEINGDSIEISINKFKAGNIQWQLSNDKTNWKNIDGAQGEVLNHKINGNSSFRAKVTNGNCTYFSDEITIEAFDFNYRDKAGNPIVSKNSEFIILIPDIQNYISVNENNKYLENIMDWILKFNASGFKVKSVLQVGDVTNFNSVTEWEAAQKIFSKLNNKVNYILTTGNHDYGENGICNNRNTLFSQYFNFKNNNTLIKTYENNLFENNFCQIDIHNEPFQILSLEFGPRNKVIDWADSIAKSNPEVPYILMTHAYLFKDKERFNFAEKRQSQKNSPHDYRYLYPLFGVGTVNDGEEIWNKLIYPNPNIKMVVCGHQTTTYIGNLISKNIKNNDVLQLLLNTQSFPKGGEGWIQIFEFYNDKKTVGIKTYSTLLNSWNDSPLHQYQFHYNNN